MRRFFPDLLATRWGRLTAFCLLYVTEGIPLGFTATAIATQMRRQGLGPAEIGLFVGSLYLPWAFKWIAGPFVDTITSERFGRRRTWIVAMQVMMIVTLLIAIPINFTANLKLFTLIILIHNAFCATQDVAIDALAVGVLKEGERGMANGFMFGGATLGQTIGGSGALFLAAIMPFKLTYIFVAGCIGLVTVFVALPIREPRGPERARETGRVLAAVGAELRTFVLEAWRTFRGSRAATIGLLYALVPTGAYALGLALQSNLAVELGLKDNDVAQLNLWSTIISATCCIAGGWLSDRFGRRRTLGTFLFMTALPTLWLAYAMQHAPWIHAIAPNAPNRPIPPASLVTTFWIACLVYNVFQGLYYGIQSALFMDITNPRVAATQFTAYMAMLNLVIVYTSSWQGFAIAHWGYPTTLTLDASLGMVGIALLPFLKVQKREGTLAEAGIPPGSAIPEAVSP
jgi:PAT family beta-lactamase induction signal transducer AmpG